MKNIFRLLVGMALVAIVALFIAAASGTSTTTKVLGQNQWYYEFTPTSAQYLGGVLGKDTLDFVIEANKGQAVRATAYVDVASRKGSTDTYSFDLQGKNFSPESYTSVFAGAGKTADYALADTTLPSEVEIGKFYRYWKVQLATDNSCATTDSMTFTKIYIKLVGL